MKNLTSKCLAVSVLAISLIAFSSNVLAERCEIRNGYKVCWARGGVKQCNWVNGYWQHGYYHSGHKVCWYR